MQLFKNTFYLALSLVVLLFFSLVVYLYYKAPNYQGKKTLEGISQPSTVYFDDFGVPHIYAANEIDAMTVLGYVHAQDRLWQMELMRRIAPGRLAEIFGTKALKSDMFFAGTGINEQSIQTIAAVDKTSSTFILATAYLKGINQFIDEGTTPIEFDLLGIPKEKYSLKDVYNIFGFMSFSFAMAQKTDPLATDIREQLGSNYLEDLGIKGCISNTQLKSYNGKFVDYSNFSKALTTIIAASPAPPFIGSNSWVIGATKTKSGKVLFSNDPHIGFSQPCIWYEAHIVTPKHELYGYYLAGTPFPLLGHNRKYAYGLTMFENDDLDLFQEENNPKKEIQYKTALGYKEYQLQTTLIKVKDSASVVLKVKKSQHGPLINNLLPNLSIKSPVAMSWIYTQQPNHILEAVYALSHANGLDDFHKNIELINAPGLNIMYGDALNNIAWITSGKLYKLPNTVNPNFILNGSNSIDDKKEFIPFSKHPAAINPPWNYVYSANNQPEAIDGYVYPGYYLPEDRAKRIKYLVESKNDWTAAAVQNMLLDNTSAVIPDLLKDWIQTIELSSLNKEETNALSILRNWKGTNAKTETAPTIFNKWLYCYLKNTFQDELGTTKFNAFLGTHLLKQTIAIQSKNVASVWWDNVATKHLETKNDILNQSFKQAIKSLNEQLGTNSSKWTWNRVHTLEHQHPLGKVAALRSVFNVGPYEVDGANEVINNLMYLLSEDGVYKVSGGPSTRRVIDFSDVENSVSILPTGQSGVISSQHYKDQAKMYSEGKFRKMKMNKTEIIKTATKFIFLPK